MFRDLIESVSQVDPKWAILGLYAKASIPPQLPSNGTPSLIATRSRLFRFIATAFGQQYFLNILGERAPTDEAWGGGGEGG